MNLRELKCQACRPGTPALTLEECEHFLKQLTDWQLLNQFGIAQIQKAYQCANFSQALELTNAIGAIAEMNDHHPLIMLEWGRVTVNWWTHSVNGLHLNDFVMAVKTDEVAQALLRSSSRMQN